MLIYPHEFKAGLKDIIENNISISYLCTPIEIEKTDDIIGRTNIALANCMIEQQEDLFYCDNILVSLGSNLNDDVFLAEEVFPSRNTPINKPFNEMHRQRKIIGHTISSWLLDGDKNLCDPSKSEDELFSEFRHIGNTDVIYTAYKDDDDLEEISCIIQGIKNGDWKVSMECWFKNFDYGFEYKDGKKEIVQRNESTAFLSQHLRAYGGTGLYKDVAIKRVLRRIIFTGKGLVDTPANPDSIFTTDFSQALIVESIKMDELEKVTKELSEAQALIETLTNEVSSLKTELSQKVEACEALQQDVVRVTATLTVEQEEKVALATELEAIKTESASVREELNVIKANLVTAGRVSKLVEAGYENNRANELVELYKSLTDDMFNAIVDEVKLLKTAKASVKEEEVPNLDNAKIDEEPNLSVASQTTNVSESTTASIVDYLKTKMYKKN